MKNLDEFSFSTLFEALIVPYNQENLKGFVTYNNLGMIHQGNKITLNKDGRYTLQSFENGKPTKSEIIEDIKAYNPNVAE